MTAMTSSVLPAARSPDELAGRGMGILFLAFFGTFWLFSAAGALPSAHFVARAAIVLAGLTLGMSGWRQFRRYRRVRSAPDSQRAQRKSAFAIINIIQWSVIIGLSALLNLTGHEAWIVPGVILIVGVHFLPLARLFSAPDYWLVGAALIAVALLYPFATPGGPASAIGPLCTGLILWTSCVVTLVRSLRSSPV